MLSLGCIALSKSSMIVFLKYKKKIKQQIAVRPLTAAQANSKLYSPVKEPPIIGPAASPTFIARLNIAKYDNVIY